MQNINWSKLTTGVFAALFAGITLWAAVFFLQMHQELTMHREQEEVHKRKLAELQAKLEEQRKYLDRLQHDPALVETIIRQKLGYVRADEFVFRFEDKRSQSEPTRP